MMFKGNISNKYLQTSVVLFHCLTVRPTWSCIQTGAHSYMQGLEISEE